MANTITLNSVTRGVKQFQGAFKEMFVINATIADTEAIVANDTLRLSMDVTGILASDMIIGIAMNDNYSDGTDFVSVSANTWQDGKLGMLLHADVGAFAADSFNGNKVQIIVGRPNW